MTAQKNVESVHRLTPTQEGILYHADRSAPGEAVYLQQFTCVLRGPEPFDRARFENAWRATVARHALLRAQLNWRKREHPLHVVRSQVETRVDWLAPGEDFAAWVLADRQRPLDLENAPVHRLALQPVDGGARLLWTFHHALLDGWSMRIVLADLCALHGGASLPPAPNVHANHVSWLLERLAAPEEAVVHWRGVLEGVEEPCSLALAPRNDTPATLSTALSEVGTRAIEERAREGRVTLSSVLRTAWALVLARYTGRRDVLFGTTVSGRSAPVPGIQDGVGMFVSTLPVRVRVGDEDTLGPTLERVHADAVASVPHEWLPLAKLQAEASDVRGRELFDTLLVVENHATPGVGAALRIEEPHFVERSHYGVALLAVPGARLELLCVVDGRTADRTQGQRLLDAMARVLTAMAQGGATARTADLLVAVDDPGEVTRSAVHAPAALHPEPVDLAASIRDHIARSPDAVALATGTETWTYAQLGARAGSFAAALGADGVAEGDIVLLALPRGPEAIAAQVGCLLSGIVYAPVPHDTSDERLDAMRRGVGAVRIVRDLERVPHRAGSVDDETQPRRDGLAYVLFTSGSTGTPKGVEITRAALGLSTEARREHYGDNPSSFLLVSPLHFDSSVAGIWWTLATGGRLVLPSEAEGRDPASLTRLAAEHAVTHTLLLPSLWQALAGPFASAGVPLELVVVAGESCRPELVREHADLHPTVRLENEYGPTECTVWATAARLDGAKSVTIGRPVGTVVAGVFDDAGLVAPPGVAGELCLAGATLARGYANDAELTAERFVERDWPDGVRRRTYRTGDRARLLPSGEFEFLGRLDDQVKVRGQRIELAAVETALRAAPGVRDAGAAVFGATRQLGAAVVTDGSFDASAATRALRSALPAAAVPSRLVELEDLPRSRTGKLDRRALETLLAAHAEDTAAAAPALSPDEERVAAIWRDVLGLESVGPDDDFFALGGDSLASIRVLARAHREGIVVDAVTFGEDPTVAGMVRARRTRDAALRSAEEVPESAPVTPIQRWFVGLELPERDHWNLATSLDGLPGTVDVPTVTAVLDELVGAHDALRLRLAPDGRRIDAPPAEPPRVTEVQAGDTGAAAALRAGLRLDEAGALVAGLLIRSERAGVRLVLLAHHFAVDAVSLETLAELVRARLTGASARIESGPSFLRWAADLERAQNAPEVERARDAWATRLLDARPGQLFGNAVPGRVIDAVSVDVELDAGTTRVLLDDASSAYGARRNEVWLVALSRALARALPGAHSIPIEIESHGRAVDDLPPPARDFPAASAVGWFTTTYPIVVPGSVARADDLSASIKSTKEILRTAPDGGQSFALLGSTSPADEVLFNDLGPRAADPASADPEVGPLRAATGRLSRALEVNTWLRDGALRARFTFAPPALDRRAGEALAADFVEQLRALAEHCGAPEAGGATPSDFPLAGLDQAGLDRLADLLGDD